MLRVYDGELNRLLGTAKVQHLSTLNINNPIKGYQSIFTAKGEKIGEVLVALRMILPGSAFLSLCASRNHVNHHFLIRLANDSNENLAGMSMISDTSNPPSRRNSIGNKVEKNHQKRIFLIENPISFFLFIQNDLLENGLRTYNLDRFSNGIDSSANAVESTVPFQTYQDGPTANVVEALIERTNRLREEMAKSSGKTLTNSSLNQNNNNSELFSKSLDLDNETMADLVLKTSNNFNESNDSILTDLDGLENEQSLLDDLLYGGRVELNHPATTTTSSTTKLRPTRRSSNGKPPTGRSPSPSLARVSSGASTRARSSRSRSRSLAQSSDSDTASRVSFDMPSSDLDDSGNGKTTNEEKDEEYFPFFRNAR